jgi:tetratricopeptide (TPR) repeat protein
LRAIEVDPDDIEAHIQYAELLWGMGRLDESLRETGRSLALDRTPLTLDIHGFALYMNRRYDEAEAMLEEGIAMDAAGDMHFLRTVLANLLLVEGRYREALDRFAEYLPDPEAYRLLGEALEQRDAGLVPNASVRGRAQTLMLLGEPDRALDALKELVLALPFRVMYDIWDPVLAPLHGTEVFQEVILPRLKLVGAEAEYAEDGGR